MKLTKPSFNLALFLGGILVMALLSFTSKTSSAVPYDLVEVKPRNFTSFKLIRYEVNERTKSSKEYLDEIENYLKKGYHINSSNNDYPRYTLMVKY